MSLSAAEVAHYHEQGYVIPRGFSLVEGQLANLRAALENVIAQNRGTRPEHLVSAHLEGEGAGEGRVVPPSASSLSTLSRKERSTDSSLGSAPSCGGSTAEKTETAGGGIDCELDAAADGAGSLADRHRAFRRWLVSSGTRVPWAKCMCKLTAPCSFREVHHCSGISSQVCDPP